MPTSNATIVQCAMTGYRITCSTRSSRFRTSLHAGSGRTIMNGQTWPWVVSRHDRSWPWWPDSTSEPRYKWGDYPPSASWTCVRGGQAVPHYRRYPGTRTGFLRSEQRPDSGQYLAYGGAAKRCSDLVLCRDAGSFPLVDAVE